MMDLLKGNLIELILSILTIITTYIGSKIKTIYENKINDETKRKIVKTVCEAVEQLYNDLSGNEKLVMARQYILEQLNEKGIKITDLELKMLVESTVNGFKKGFNENEN